MELIYTYVWRLKAMSHGEHKLTYKVFRLDVLPVVTEH